MNAFDAAQAAKDFARWRKRQVFASESIESKAISVERDLEILASAAGRAPSVQALAQRNIAEFEAMLAKEPAVRKQRQQRARPTLSVVESVAAAIEISG